MFFLLFQFTTISLLQIPNYSLLSYASNGYSSSKDNSFNTNSSVNKNLADYTLLIYMIGSDLESKSYSATSDLVEMKNGVHNSKLNVIVETGGGGGTLDGKRFVDFSKVQRHKIANGTISTLMDLGQRNMGDPNTLSSFIKWGELEFPAKKYAIILWDHGGGLNGFGKDLIFNNDILTPLELTKAFQSATISTNNTFELIGFDACLMSSLEVASHLQNAAHYMVSSEEVEPSWGWNYTAIIQNLTANPEQSGRSLGTAIVDSFVRHSRNLSTSEKFAADQEITLAVIDMTKLSQLVKDVNALSNALGSNIYDLPSAISLSRSIDLTEHYGQSARGSSGFVDLSNLLLNIQEKYPSLLHKINEVQNSLKATSIYKFRGEARPNANGLSVYMPLLKSEYSNTTELNVISPDWLKLLLTQRSMITSDKQPPIINSIREGNIIMANAYGSDFASIYAQIVTNSSQGNNLIYLQSIDPSLIDNDGYFQYKQHKMLVVCNETKCTPSSMKLEVNRDKKFSFIPVRLESNNGKFNEDVSLIYEIGKDGKFVFLGYTPEVGPVEKTIPKGQFSLKNGDKIFFKALTYRAQYKSVGDISGQELSRSTFAEDGKPLLVNNPEKVEPRYSNLSSRFAISFTICDYSDNSDKTRWYIFNSNKDRLPTLSHDLEFGYDVLSKGASAFSQAGLTYVNPTFGFKLEYPSDWVEVRHNIYDNSSSSDDVFAGDPKIVNFLLPKPYSSAGNLPTSVSVSVTDWPFREQPKSFFDFFNKTHNQNKLQAGNVEIIYSNATTIAGNPAFKFIFKYISNPEQSLGIVKEPRMEQIVTVLMNNRMYFIDFASYYSQFYHYLPVVEKIVNSFASFTKNINANTSSYNHINRSPDASLSKGNALLEISNSVNTRIKESNISRNIINNTIFSNYSDTVYGYKVKYPVYAGVGEPISLKNANPNFRGEMFALNDDTVRSADVSNSVNLIITAFNKNELQQTKNASPVILTPSSLKTFDIHSIISSVDGKLSSLKSILTNFTLLNKSNSMFKNHPAYIVEYKYFNPVYKSPMQEKVMHVVFGDYLFSFEYNSKPSNYYRYLPILHNMLNSFEYNGNMQSTNSESN